jgi:hypothetical protein
MKTEKKDGKKNKIRDLPAGKQAKSVKGGASSSSSSKSPILGY